MFAASKSGRAVAAGATTDQYFPNTVLLLNDTGTNGAQNNTFIDSSTNNFTITRNGNATQGSVNPFEPTGYWSGNFSGSSQYLTVSTNIAFTYGLSDFTIECWVFLTTTGVLQYIIDQRNSGTANAVIPAIYVSASNVLTYFVSNAAQITGTTALVIGTWYHVAVSRGTLSTKMFLNGTQEGSTYVDANNYAASRVVISSNAATAGNYLTGFISNVRLVNGTAVYTSAFTPPTTPLTAITNTSLLCLQNNIYKDNSSNNFTITATGTPPITGFNQFIPTASYSGNTYGGSIYFDGTGDYFLFPTNSVFAFPADFTIEYWINLASGTPTVIDLRGGFGIVGFSEFFTTGLVANIFKEGTGTILTASAGMNYNVWNHVAYVRSGTTLSIYINGVNLGSVTDSTSWAAPSTTGRISGNYTNANLINGYISNLRIVKGTAVYTSAFTPSITPLTAITNTSLLLNATNAGIYDATALNDMETVGNAQVSTTQYKWGASSMSFDGAGDYLKYPASNSFAFGANDFTIEYWIYSASWSTTPTLVDTRITSVSTNGYADYVTTGGVFNLYIGNTTIYTMTGSLSTNTWTHIAISRSGTSLRVFINGTQNNSTVTNSTNMSNTNLLVGVNRGASAVTVSTGFFNGYIEDLRITKGVARYTANFTAPTAAFPTR